MQGTGFYPNPRRGHPLRRSVTTLAVAAKRQRDDSDLKLFALSFAAFFVCFYTFLV
jgi:hypothetical protein